MPQPASSARSSPPTQRVVAILDFMAEHPHDRFGLSELARHVGLAKPTCLGIVTTLTESGYLVRDARDKTYRLGPSLIALGHIAQESMRVSPAAREASDVIAPEAVARLAATIIERVAAQSRRPGQSHAESCAREGRPQGGLTPAAGALVAGRLA